MDARARARTMWCASGVSGHLRTRGGEALCSRCRCSMLSSCVLGVLAAPYRPNTVPRRTNQSLKGLFRRLNWAARSLARDRERMRVGVGLLGQGHTPHSGSAMARWSVLPTGCAPHARGTPAAGLCLRAVSDVQGGPAGAFEQKPTVLIFCWALVGFQGRG